ncbi:Citrate lyase subunit beta [Variovorax sp. SRS16]|uniref:HpcH/HpaI aldolase/citrate lyase family protein n=1 Tax=Variovorax sp. SRS16 TaxID=282217 RepID=UPI0013164070|nr:CoA ester lyase [Variovorax sp. SRS16]VTU24557.1 Citrate lyase subunit beta [Variovorax sp. SRS16]
MRSKLFVPGSRPELFAKALAGDADGISFDLEDAVAETRKAEAREAVRAFLKNVEAVGRKILIARVNALDTPHFAADIACVAQPGLHVINLPKPETPDQVRAAADAIERAEHANGVVAPIGLLLNIETPKALRDAAALAAAHPRVVGLQLGLGDLFEPLGIDRREAAAVRQAMFAVRMAAGVAGVYAYDSAFANFRDVEGFREEAALSRRLGFLGKSCIHPSQVALANAAFRPTDAEIAHALQVLAAADAASAHGVGAYVVDGRMIDAPFAASARAVVANARRLGLLPAAAAHPTTHHE